MARRIVESPLTYFQRRFDEDWLLEIDNDRYRSIAKERYEQLQDKRQSNPHLTVLISASDPAQFLGSFIAAISAKCSPFLANPNWVEAEWQQVLDLVQPDIIWGREVPRHFRLQSTSNSRFSSRFQNPQQTAIAIPTGGTSGNIRFALHTWESLMASIGGFIEYFQVQTVNSCCTLPLYHVSGLMQFLRSLVTGGQLWILPSKKLEFAFSEKSTIQRQEWFISLVPTQLQRLLQNPESTQWLSRFQTVLLGGAPAWKELLEQARASKIRLAPTYGMTETASQIVTLKPEDFLAGNNSCGRVLPHAKLQIDGAISTDYPTTGVIQIQTASLAFGYYPQSPELEQFIHDDRAMPEMRTDDLGFFDDRGYLHIVGRCSDKIITGGENVFPTEVEAAILASHLVADLCVIGIPHPTWGQAVVAVYIPNPIEVTPDQFSLALTQKLAKFKHPKYWIPVDTLPRNDRGKVNRKAVLEIARSRLTGLLKNKMEL
jgi:o-succinylbenzoate---CoA ligase